MTSALFPLRDVKNARPAKIKSAVSYDFIALFSRPLSSHGDVGKGFFVC